MRLFVAVNLVLLGTSNLAWAADKVALEAMLEDLNGNPIGSYERYHDSRWIISGVPVDAGVADSGDSEFGDEPRYYAPRRPDKGDNQPYVVLNSTGSAKGSLVCLFAENKFDEAARAFRKHVAQLKANVFSIQRRSRYTTIIAHTCRLEG